MSLTFSEYSAQNSDKAGYFRIGHVVLATSPTDILTGRVVNNERLTVLRGRNDMVKKTGQARWDVTVRWTALLDSTAADDNGRYKQWEDLRSVLAMFHAAPFVEIENGYIRQALAEQDQTLSSSRMGFALRQLRVSTHNDIVDGLDISLTMTLFNYFPYSQDFGYVGDQGQSTDAWLCSSFAQYIEQWKQRNMDASLGTNLDSAPILNWRDQIAGTLKFRWRQYKTIKIGTGVATGVSPAAVAAINQAAVTPPTPQGKVTDKISGDGKYDSLISQYSTQYNVSPAIVKAIMWHESRFQPQALQPNYKGGGSSSSAKATLLQHILNDADGGVAYVNQYTAQNISSKGTTFAPDLGLLQVNWKNIPKLNASVRPVDMFRPETAIALGCQILAAFYAAGMPRDQIYWYLTGPDPKGKKFDATAQEFQKEIMQHYQLYLSNFATTGTSTTQTALAPTPVPPATPPPASAPDTPSGQSPGDGLTAAQQQEVMQLVNQGWSYDHAVNDVAFFYQEEQMTLTDQEHGDIANAYGLHPQQFSILFVNNLAQIPLAAYQYPTYQHIGSTSSKFSMLMMSKGTRESEDQEPAHNGITVLSSASEYLEAQYLRLRNQWRSVSSVHRMQAFYVENQILNMLGVRGITVDSINTSTLPNMSDTIQVEVSGAQYENIFEVSSPYKITTIDSSGQATAQSIVNSGQLASLSKDEANTVTEISSFAQGRSSSSLPTLESFILKVGKVSNVSFASFDALGNASAPSSTITILMKPFLSSDLGYPSLQARLKQAQAKGLFTFGDCIIVRSLVSSQSGTTLLSSNAAASDPDLTAADNYAQGLLNVFGANTNTQATYDALFPLLVSYDSNFATDVNTIATSPQFSSQFNQNVNPAGPGSDSVNAGHGAYNDLGLSTLTLNGQDFNPGYYFFDHNADYLAQVRQNLDSVVTASTQSATAINTPVRPDSFDISITESTFVGQNADTNSLVRMTNIPGYNMYEAFPAFKLFLMEDSSPGLIQAFDNFYSYASVLDIEIIRYMDKPDLAQIQITNLANILQHKLFDNTLQGKYELEQYKREFFSITPSTSSPVAGEDPESAIVVGKTASNQLYQVQRLSGYDLRDGVNFGQPERIPLQYAVLQPGTKIQVRMGYSNNPDLLTPVFTGRVSSVQGQEILTIEAESYLAEICDLPTKDDKPVAGKKYGGWQPWHDSGDVASVVENLIRTDTAKHFGAFKLATVSDPLITGLTWQNRIGKMIGEFSLSPANELARVGAAMSSSYDRSAENILINHVINHLGNPTKQRLTRDFYDESTGPFDIFYQFDYKIPDNSTKTTWELIKDICRRYPEYIVTAKQYGFPYSADATLVVAHPLDWYFARLPMIGDAERFSASQTATSEFTAWWQSQGQAAWNTMLDAIKSDQANLVRLNPPTPTTPQQFTASLQTLRNEVVQFIGVAGSTSNETLNYLDQLLGSAVNALESPSENSKTKAAIAEIVEVQSLWDKYVELQNPQSNDRLKPVRRYHFIDHQTIVHNGMRLNDKIYNAIRIGSHTAKVNANIPSHYTRTLDVTDLLVESKENVEPYTHIVRSVQQSFMKEEVGKMYDGEIVLRGVPEIEPGDCLVLLDPSTSIVGTVDVDHVIHSFNQETGYTTICYPQCVTAVNESASANMGRMFSMIMAKSISQTAGGLVDITKQAGKAAQLTDGIGIAATAVAATAGVALIGTPPGEVVLALGAIAMFGGLLYAANKSETGNMIEVMPVTRWGRPWVGGLEGYQISDFWQNLQNSFAEFKADNIYPLLDTYRFFKGAPSNTLPVQPTK